MDSEPAMVHDAQLVPTPLGPPPVAPLDPHTETFSIAGGITGHVAMTEDLRSAVLALDEAAGLLAEATACTVATEDLLDAVPGAFPDSTWQLMRARCAVAAVMAGPTGTRRAEMALTDIRDRLRITVDALEEAENATNRTMSWVARVKDAMLDDLGLRTYLPRAALAGLWHVMPAGGISRMAGHDPVGSWLTPGVPETTGLVNRDALEKTLGLAPEQVRVWAMRLAAISLRIAELRFGEPRYLSMRANPGVLDGRPAPSSTADLLTTVFDTEQLDNGSVTIQRVMGPEGECFIVSIPGTQDVTLNSGRQTDWQANAAYMAGYRTDAMQAVVDAIAAAQIPAGAPMMLVGHSQGGIGAMALASSPQFLAKYNVTHVVTSGAPTGIFTAPSHVQSLHYENPADITPGSDFTPNTNGANQITVTHHTSLSANSELADASGTIGGAHHMRGYIATARMTDELGDRAVEAFVDSASPFLSGSFVETTVYTPKTA